MKNAREIFGELLAKGSGRIKLLGDSITHGVGGSGFAQDGAPITAGFARNPRGYCWANRFAELMASRYGIEVLNNACTGTTVGFVIEHFCELVSDADDLVICTIGTNNRHQYFKDAPKKSYEEMREGLKSQIERLASLFAERGKPFILVANIPASPQNERDGGDFWRILHMSDVNEIYKEVRDERGFAFISMYDLFSDYLSRTETEITSLLGDGLHPNDKGYDVMLELILGELIGD